MQWHLCKACIVQHDKQPQLPGSVLCMIYHVSHGVAGLHSFCWPHLMHLDCSVGLCSCIARGTDQHFQVCIGREGARDGTVAHNCCGLAIWSTAVDVQVFGGPSCKCSTGCTGDSAATLYMQWKLLHSGCLMLGVLLVQLYLLLHGQLQVRSSCHVPQTYSLGIQVAVDSFWTLTAAVANASKVFAAILEQHGKRV